MATLSIKDVGLVIDEASLTAAFDCEESAGELPTRALSDALIFQASGDELTLCDLEVLDGKTPTPVDVIGRITRIDKVMDPVPDAELGPNVRLRGVTEWSVEYDALTATVWVSTATADYKLVRPAPAYAKLWEELELKTLLSARAIALITETKGLTFGQLRQHVVGLNSVEGHAALEFGAEQLSKHGSFIADQIAGSEGLAKCKALQGMRQEIRRLSAPPSAAALEKAAKATAAKEAKQAGKEAAQVEKEKAKAARETERASKAEAERAKKAEKAREKDAREKEAQAKQQAAKQQPAKAAGGSGAGPSSSGGRKRDASEPSLNPVEKKRTKFETYASATSNSMNRPTSDDPNDRYKMQRVVLDAPHVLPPGCWCLTRKLTGEHEELSNQYGMVLGHDGTEEDGIYYHVKIQSSGEIVRLKFSELMQRCKVELTGLVGRADLNGCDGYIESATEDKGRYTIKVQQMGKKDEWLSLKPTNAALPPPTRVRLTGLVQASQYNGRIVKIVRTDLEAGRYEVTMFEDEDTKRVQKALRLKFENALLW